MSSPRKVLVPPPGPFFSMMNFFVTRFSKKITRIFKELCLCWFSSKRKYRLISPLAIHIYFFFINFVFACFAFLILLKNGQVFFKNFEFESKSRNSHHFLSDFIFFLKFLKILNLN